MKKPLLSNIVGAIIPISIAWFWVTTNNIVHTQVPDATHTCPYKFRGEPGMVYLTQSDCNTLDYGFYSVFGIAIAGTLVGLFLNKGWSSSKRKK